MIDVRSPKCIEKWGDDNELVRIPIGPPATTLTTEGGPTVEIASHNPFRTLLGWSEPRLLVTDVVRAGTLALS